MTSSSPPPSGTDEKMLMELRQTKEQVRGLQRMIAERRDCHDIPISSLGRETLWTSPAGRSRHRMGCEP